MTGSTETQSRDEARIRGLIAERASALRARDAERLVSHYAPEVVRFDLAPPLRTGADETRDPDRLREWFAGFEGPIIYQVRDLEVTVGGDVAFCHSLNRLAAIPRSFPEGFDLWFRATVCLSRQGGDWRIVHEHNSTPFYMEGSFDAALDLQP